MSIMQRHRKRLTPRACYWCDTVFTPRYKDEVYCAPDCGHAHRSGMQRVERKRREVEAERVKRERDALLDAATRARQRAERRTFVERVRAGLAW